ncbi:MAG: metallophosphoesterase [Thermodesulfobacteriota bacterium]
MLYRLAVRFFNLMRPAVKAVLFFFLIVFLSLSFPLSRLLLHWQENLFTRIYYIFSNFWLGPLAILLMGAFLIWMILKIFNFKEPSSKAIILSSVIFILAMSYSVYGLWNAFNPRIKRLEIRITNLPPGWRGKTIVQLSDIHLGLVHQADFMQRIAEITRAIHPDLIVITGDLFNGRDGNLESFLKPINQLEASKGIFFVTGNHEFFLGLRKVFSLLSKTRINILNDQTVNIDGLQIVGLGYSSFAGETDIQKEIQSLPNFKKGLPSVLLYHTPTNTEQAKASGINLQLSGHTHKGQFFLVELFEWMIYKKYYYGLHQEGDFSIYTTSGLGTVGPPMRLNSHSEIVVITLK